MEDYDALSEILLKIDPSNILKFILISKDWLEVMRDPTFREVYMKKWNSELVGFLIEDRNLLILPRLPELYALPLAVQMLPMSDFGRMMNQKKLMPEKRGQFIAKSNNGFILSGVHPKKYYVFNPLRNQVHRLPQPTKWCPCVAIAIMSSPHDDGNKGYKVIQAKVEEQKSLIIQTYSSSTGTWEKLKVACSTKFWLKKNDVGTLTRDGVLYWNACTHHPVRCLAAYDTNTTSITLLKIPYSFFDFPHLDYHDLGFDHDLEENDWGVNSRSEFYSKSPNGLLRCATCCSTIIKIWELEDVHHVMEPDFDAIFSNLEDDGDDAGWSLKYEIDLEVMWVNNADLLGLMRRRPFLFVSFVDGK